MAERGIELNDQEKSRLTQIVTASAPDLEWITWIVMPFSWAGSKNRIYNPHIVGGHRSLREEAKAFRNEVIARFLSTKPKVVQGKLWISLFIQKTIQRGDAVNFVDTICDALTVALGLDDRWFSINRIDWEIVKRDPRIYIGVGQETNIPVQACSSCGRLLPFDSFNKNAHGYNGIGRNCSDCRKGRAKDVDGCEVTVEAL